MIKQLMEEAQIGQELQLQAYDLLMQAPAAISAYMGTNHTVVLANDFALQLAGKSRQQVIGKPILSVLPEVEAQGIVKILDTVLTTGESYASIESPLRLYINHQSCLLYLNLLYKPYRDKHGTIVGVLGFATDVTEQVQARQRAEKTEQQFNNVLSQAPDPILILKGDDLVLDVANDAVLSLWNITKRDIGRPFLELLPEMKEQGFYDLLLDVYKNVVTHHGYETPVFFNRNGARELHYFNFVYHPYREVDNSVGGVLIIASDVTEQVKARAKLAEAEKDYITLVMQAPIGICILQGPDFVVELANDAYLELVGRKRNQFVGYKLWNVLPEAKEQHFDDILETVMQTGKTFRGVEHPIQLFRHGHKETVYIDFVYEPIDESISGCKRIMVLAYDVTDKVLARRKIEDAEQDARLAIELADLGTYELEISTNSIVTSDRFNSIFGFDETVSRHEYVKTVHPEDRASRENAYELAMQTGKLFYEVRVIWRDNSVHWVRVKGDVVFDSNQVPHKIKGVVQDITDQKRSGEELSRQVAERTNELREANTRLSKSNAELEQFAYITSHDLLEPVRKIQIFSDMVANQFTGSEAASRYLQKITSSAKRINDLIRNLLDYSRISNAAMLFEPVNLNIVLAAIIADYELLIEQKNAQLQIDGLEVIDAIPLQMNQLFYNLIGNALKFSRKNITPEIRVTGERLRSSDCPQFPHLNFGEEYLKIEVSDNGIGFNQEYATQIFTIFQRLNDNSVFGGYGIGLAICKKIVDNHSGFIFAQGKEDEGACFVILLPVKQS